VFSLGEHLEDVVHVLVAHHQALHWAGPEKQGAARFRARGLGVRVHDIGFGV